MRTRWLWLGPSASPRRPPRRTVARPKWRPTSRFAISWTMNNGPTKGGHPEAWQTVRSSPGLVDFWQGHYSVEAGDEYNAPEQFIANFDESREGCTAHWIKVSAAADGSFSVTNGRNGFSKSYAGS